MRYEKDGSENYQLVEDILDNKISPNIQSANEGDLMIFKGNKSLHRVTEVIDGERILITFNYNNVKGVPLSEQSRKTFFGRIA
jgi:predicted 2-oxoglutarate/Fe(II)-dependent dioxygenase YbiX